MAKFWIFKTEPGTFSIDDFKKAPKSVEPWDGIRNYQVRNFIRDDMKKGDMVLIYHSSCKPPGVAGVAKIVKEAYPDHTAFDKKSKYYDPKSDHKNPRWLMVDLKFIKKFKNFIPLNDLKEHEKLEELVLLKRGNRLSIMPIEEDEFNYIRALGE